MYSSPVIIFFCHAIFLEGCIFSRCLRISSNLSEREKNGGRNGKRHVSPNWEKLIKTAEKDFKLTWRTCTLFKMSNDVEWEGEREDSEGDAKRDRDRDVFDLQSPMKYQEPSYQSLAMHTFTFWGADIYEKLTQPYSERRLMRLHCFREENKVLVTSIYFWGWAG